MKKANNSPVSCRNPFCLKKKEAAIFFTLAFQQ